MEEVTFRPATAADLEDIVALINKCFGQEDTVEYARAAWEKPRAIRTRFMSTVILGMYLLRT